MDQPTRQSAVKKLNAIQNKIGYPEHWTDLSALQLDSSSHIANQISLSHFWTLRTMKKIGQPVDRTEWEMTPSTVNAYYNPQMNEIVFPTGILQSPFYSKTASLASNYGAIAMVIGHELTHGFDDEGRQFDESGNLKDWWSKDVAEVFDRKTQCVVDQYSAYTVADGVHVNGALTLGENIADLGGLKLAYKAFRSVAPADEERAADSFTQDQEFFISFAQSWCTQSSEEYEKLGAATDPHSPPKYRVNGTVTNLPEFERAFRCSPGAPLAPKVRCSIW
jgi:predicted metalloendopeptidase